MLKKEFFEWISQINVWVSPTDNIETLYFL